MSGLVNRALAYVGVLLLGVTSVAAQDAAEPQAVAERQVWTAEASAGFSLISGNKETSTLNIAFDASYSPDARHTIKSNGLMIRGKTDGELSADRLGLNVRDEYQLNGRAFVFGQHRYLSDEVKDIAYLFAPTGGFGYRLVDTSATEVSLDAGIGGVWEKNANSVTRSSGAVTVGEEVSPCAHRDDHAHADLLRAVEDARPQRLTLRGRRERRCRHFNADAAEGGSLEHVQEQAFGRRRSEERRGRARGAGVHDLTGSLRSDGGRWRVLLERR